MRKRSGHVLLPMFGIVYYLPWFLFAGALVSNLAKHGQSSPHTAMQGLGILATSCCLGIVFYVLFIFATIFFAISTEVMEAWAQRVGLGAPQYWCGDSVREKVLREIVRFAHFGLALWLGYITSTAIWSKCADGLPRSLDLWILGALAFAHGFYSVLFLIIGSIHERWPWAFGFKGNPGAQYSHAF